MIGRAAVVDGANAFAHGVISTPGELDERLAAGTREGLLGAVLAPLGPLSRRGSAQFAPLTARYYPLLVDQAIPTFATGASQEVISAMAETTQKKKAAAKR